MASRLLRSILFILGVVSLAPALAGQAAAADTPPYHAGIIDKVFGVVGPDEPIQLTEGKRFHLYLLSTVGPIPVLGEAVGAGFSQWENSPKEWGQSWDGYGKRFGSNLAYNAVRQTITYGISIPLREDNRYFVSHKHGFWARTGYAVLSTVTARHPDGNQAFSFSAVAGIAGASSISSIWGPGSWKGVGNISANAGISFGTTAAFNIAREFLPDVLHRPHK